jgi:MFS family permease
MSLKKSLAKAYSFSFFWMFLVLIPVMVPFYQSLGLTMERIFQLQAIFGLTVMLCEVPAGYFCDLLGRRKTLCLGAVFNGIGFTFLLVAKSFPQLVIFEGILAMGMALVSGADLSLILDSVEDQHGHQHAQKQTHALANFQLAQTGGEAVASVLGGFLAAISFRSVIIANLVSSWIPLAIALTLDEPIYKKMTGSTHWENFSNVIRYVCFGDRVLRVIFLNLLCWGLATFSMVWIFQKYWEEHGVALAWFGALWAGFNLSVGVMGKMVHRLEGRWGKVPLFYFLCIAPVIGYFGMSLATGLWGVAIGLLFYLSRGVNQVLLREAYNARIPSEFRATANSLQTGMFRLAFAVFGPAIGYSIDRFGVSKTLAGLGSVFSVFLFLLIPPMVSILRKPS